MSYQRWFYHPVCLWLIVLVTLFPASIVTWGLFWQRLGLGNGMMLAMAALLLAQGIIWASAFGIRSYRINSGNRKVWLRALTIPAIAHGALLMIGVFAPSAPVNSSTLLLGGPILACSYMWMLVRQSQTWQPPRPAPSPRRKWQWRSMPARALAVVTLAKLPLPQPNDRQTVFALVYTSAIALVATAVVIHGIATNDLVVVSKRGSFHVSGTEIIPFASLYICLVLICLSVVAGHRDERPNAHVYRRFRNVMAWITGALLTYTVLSPLVRLIALIASGPHR
ncbi:hypothetical protein [Pseudomonas cichorii]|uniref:hypothetical protein n=1 Tax=Pseudomonas cichorii TaxID=36746 RepID=UPI001C8933C1|nr:hypothetical protein [Pseudomonas cichorii]MBX8484839.1 hypothetical protein [Pseudomonas cichorii]